MTKTSKITACTFNNVWNPPTGGTLYLHSISFENGDMGKIYSNSQLPTELSVNQTLSYTINDKMQIKKVDTPSNNVTEIKKPNSQKQTDIVGLAFSYAKDIMVASMAQGTVYKKLPDDFIKIAMPIYTKMNELKDVAKQEDANNGK
jgi:isocitrate dehydrogenase